MRFVISLLLGAVATMPAHADEASAEAIMVETANGPMRATRLAAPDEAPRPAVLILHGRQGIEPLATAYGRYAADLAAAGMDAWVVSYYGAADAAAMNDPDRSQRSATFNARIGAWAKAIDDVAGFVLARKESSGRVGLLGFSNGGFLAVAAAADPRISALVVFYGGILDVVRDNVVRLPPLLAVHGDADRTIPISDGRELVERARALGGEAELITYPGAGHGFDFAPHSRIADDARSRAIAFLRSRLGRAP
jgi:carboxymethylenebutenolidase